MAGRGSKRHTHKYQKIDLSFVKTWACALPDCTHYMPKHMERMVEGKASICWECEKEFVLDRIALTMDRPTCLECRNPLNIDDTLMELLRDKTH